MFNFLFFNSFQMYHFCGFLRLYRNDISWKHIYVSCSDSEETEGSDEDGENGDDDEDEGHVDDEQGSGDAPAADAGGHEEVSSVADSGIHSVFWDLTLLLCFVWFFFVHLHVVKDLFCDLV